MESISFFTLVVLVISGFARAAVNDLRIGVMDSWLPTLQSALEDKNLSMPVTLVDISPGDTRSAYERIDKTYSTVQNLAVHALIGPYDPALTLVAESLKISYLATTQVPYRGDQNYTFQVMPEMKWSAQAILDIAQTYGWERISVFYDDDSGVQVLEELMTNHTITVRAWRLSTKAEQRQVRNALVEMRKVLVEKSVVLCSKENTHLLLEQARDLAMLSTPPYGWLFYDPGDEGQKVFTKYKEIAVNFTVVTLLDFNDPIETHQFSRLEYALASDALQLVTSSYSMVAAAASATYMNLSDVSVRSHLKRAIDNNVEFGHTGFLDFNEKGRRNNFSLSITAITGDFDYQRGHWFSDPPDLYNSLVLYTQQFPYNRSTPFPLRGRTARVVMIEERPFTMKKRDHMLRRGNDKFEGFAVDLIEEVGQMLGFDYDIYLVNDGKFGTKLPSGEWNGMIGELLAGNATMSVAPLSINALREEAVDFTKPFKTRYISVLMRIPRRETSYFEFLNPLSRVVWICTLCAFVVVSLVLYALERIGREKGQDGGDSIEITVRESFWFIFGSLLQGNTDSTPCTIPGRILTSAWWFFALILISSYTANLAAFLTVKKINTPIKSVTDLAQQTKIKYGTVKDSGIMSFFKNTNIEHFSKMWAQMSEVEPDSMVQNTTEGFMKVREEDYAFFWDTTVNKYQTISDCDVMEIGPAFDPKGFGIGVPPGATYREELSMAILRLSDQGKLHEIETKWWDNTNCPDMTKNTGEETSSLQIDNVAGVFFILVGGIVIAAIVCLGEYFTAAMIKASKLAVAKKVSAKPKDRAATFASSSNRGDAERDSFI